MAWSKPNRALTDPGLRIDSISLLICELLNIPGTILWRDTILKQTPCWFPPSQMCASMPKHDDHYSTALEQSPNPRASESHDVAHLCFGVWEMQVIVSKPTYQTAGVVINWGSSRGRGRDFHSIQQFSNQTLVERQQASQHGSRSQEVQGRSSQCWAWLVRPPGIRSPDNPLDRWSRKGRLQADCFPRALLVLQS